MFERPVEDTAKLKKIANQLRKDVVKMTYLAGSGHPGGSLSAADMMAVLFFYKMKLDPKNPKWEGRDYFILSKGHICPVYYSALCRVGFFPEDELWTLRKFGSRLQGHPASSKMQEIEVSTGSLGQGLSVANGIALGLKLDGKPNRVYCMLGDGELQEGQVWEAIMTAAHYKLDNVCAIVDYNNLQIDGFVEDVMGIAPLADKWRAFNWEVIEIDGHDIDQIKKALDEAENIKGKPTVIIAHTVKGKGVSFMENEAGWHGKAPSKEEYEKAMAELEAQDV